MNELLMRYFLSEVAMSRSSASWDTVTERRAAMSLQWSVLSPGGVNKV